MSVEDVKGTFRHIKEVYVSDINNSVATISQNFAKQNSGFQNWFRKIKVAKFCITLWPVFCPKLVKIVKEL